MKTYEDYLKVLKEAEEDFSKKAKEEEENDYGDAMQSIERAEAQGYFEGLELVKELIEALTKKEGN